MTTKKPKRRTEPARVTHIKQNGERKLVALKKNFILRLDEVVLDDDNPLDHSADDIEPLKASLVEYGQQTPIVIEPESKRVLKGNGTVIALRELGATQVLCTHSDLEGERATGYKIADNITGRNAKINEQRLAAQLQALRLSELPSGFSDQQIKRLIAAQQRLDGKAAPEAQIDRAEELQKKWKVRRGQIWQIGKHRLMCGDSTTREDVEKLLAGAKPKLMVTDPPYGVEYDPSWRDEAAAKGLIAYATRRIGEVENDDRADWTETWKLSPSDVAYCWHDGRRASNVQANLEAAGFEIRCQVVWAKSRFAISRGHYHWQHEPCWYAVRKGKAADWSGDRSQTTLWAINLDANVEGGHGTQKPVECMKRAIRNHEGDVYEPFCGSGTTIAAAEFENRACFAMEIKPEYCAVTLERLSQMGLTPKLIEGKRGK